MQWTALLTSTTIKLSGILILILIIQGTSQLFKVKLLHCYMTLHQIQFQIQEFSVSFLNVAYPGLIRPRLVRLLVHKLTQFQLNTAVLTKLGPHKCTILLVYMQVTIVWCSLIKDNVQCFRLSGRKSINTQCLCSIPSIMIKCLQLQSKHFRWPNTVFTCALANTIQCAHKYCIKTNTANRAIILFA